MWTTIRSIIRDLTAGPGLLERARASAALAGPFIAPQPAFAGTGALHTRAPRPIVFAKGKGGGSGDDDDDDDGDDDDDDDADKVTLTKAEHDRLKRKVSEGDKARKRFEDRISDLEAKLEDAEHGDDELKKAVRRAERAEADAETAKARVEELEGEITTEQRTRSAIEIATREGFKNPARAVKLLSSDDLETESSAESALKRLAREEPYMVNKRGQRDVTRDRDDDDRNDDDDDRDGKSRNGDGGDEPVGVGRMRSYYADKESGDKGEGD